MIRDKQTPGAERTLETMAEAGYNVKLDAPVGYLVHEPTRTRISVYKPMGCIYLTDKIINKGYTCFAPFCYLLTIIGQLCNKGVKQQKSKKTFDENTDYKYE